MILLLHRFGASVFSRREVRQPFGKLGTAAAYDRPAFGLTERPLPGSWQGESLYSMASQTELLVALIDELGYHQRHPGRQFG